MRMNKRGVVFLFLILTMLWIVGCAGPGHVRRKAPEYAYPEVEALWIRDGQPLEFNDELWYPERNVEVFRDEEVDLVGEYQGTPFFVEKIDIRPFQRLYTKFGRNKFRSFEKK